MVRDNNTLNPDLADHGDLSDTDQYTLKFYGS